MALFMDCSFLKEVKQKDQSKTASTRKFFSKLSNVSDTNYCLIKTKLITINIWQITGLTNLKLCGSNYILSNYTKTDLYN